MESCPNCGSELDWQPYDGGAARNYEADDLMGCGRCGHVAEREVRDPEPLSSCLGCSDDCEHTAEEHAAFDAGVMAGCGGASENDCPPYEDFDLREAWRGGGSAGARRRG
jgi:ribosome modulation factor